MARVDRRLAAIIGVGVVAVATTLIIVFLAIVPVPEFDAVRPGEQSGYVAYLSGEEGDVRSLHIVDLNTTATVEVDIDEQVEIVGWDDEGRLVVHNWQHEDRYTVFDPTTGDEVGTIDPGQSPDSLWEQQAFVDQDGDTLVLEQPRGTGSASFTAPESYDIHQAVSMDDDRIVFLDELGRVAVTPLGEDVEPLLIASDALEWSGVAARP